MIKEITFEEIKPYWKRHLWSEWENISKVNLWTQEKYCYKAFDYISNSRLNEIINVTYIGYFINDKIVGVESGYKTNFDYYRVRGLWVNENYRKKGIATNMIRYLEDKSNEKYIWSIPRKTALGFYLKYGFSVTGMIKDNYFVVKERNETI